MSKTIIQIKDIEVKVDLETDFISLTDIAKTGRGRTNDIIRNYLKNRSNIEFLGLWEEMHNENFNYDQMAVIKNEVSANDYTLNVGEWIKLTNATGIQTSTGRYGGTYAHKDIAIHFAAWLNPSFYLYLIKEFQRLKEKESGHWMQTLEFFLNRAELHSLEANRFVRDMLELTEQLKIKKKSKK